jgi:hypothetical protein
MFPDCLKQPSKRRIEWILPDLNCGARFSCCVVLVNALVTKRGHNEGRKIPYCGMEQRFTAEPRQVNDQGVAVSQ